MFCMTNPCITAWAALTIFLAVAASGASAQSLSPITTGDITPSQAPSGLEGPPPPAPNTGILALPPGAAAEVAVPRPFGATMFDAPILTASTGPNPDYLINIGDQIMVRIWGSVTADLRAAVDQQGNIFIPEVGPIPVAGVRAGDLSEFVARHIRTVYRDNVAVYVTLMQWQSIGVFVSGFVPHPGRFPGISTESILEYLSRAGGIDEERGSFRDIRVLRDNAVIARVDLYDFLTDGFLPRIQFRDSDTIIVSPQRPTVAVSGAVRNGYRFETPADNRLSGEALIRLARPLPQTTHVWLQGTRNGQPISEYFPLAEARAKSFEDQDNVSFMADAPQRTLTVEVSGARLGRSVFIIDPDATLLRILEHIEIDPLIADLNAVHIRRQSVARQQKASLEASLDRLERSLLNVSVATEGEAQIRKVEAELVSRYIARARTVEPDGTVVVLDSDGKMVNIRLEDGDQIVIPEKRTVVIVSGEVLAPQAIAYERNQTAAQFIERAGGYATRADESQIILRKTNGQVLIADVDTKIAPGDEIIVPPKVEFKTFQFTKDIFQLIFQSAVTAGVLLRGF